jgi:hypothetical protein
MQAMQVAFARDLVYWIGGVFTVICAGVTKYSLKTKQFPKIAAVPMLAIGTVLAYQIDYAYGNKANRVNKIKEDILMKEKHWFVPIVPTNQRKSKFQNTIYMDTNTAVSTISRATLLVVTIFLFVCCWHKRHLQPLKSRGVVPFTCLICFFIAVTTQAVEVILNPSQIPGTTPYCYVIAMGDLPFFIMINLMMVLQVNIYSKD